MVESLEAEVGVKMASSGSRRRQKCGDPVVVRGDPVVVFYRAVRHRYSEFSALRVALGAAACRIVAPFPPKVLLKVLVSWVDGAFCGNNKHDPERSTATQLSFSLRDQHEARGSFYSVSQTVQERAFQARHAAHGL